MRPWLSPVKRAISPWGPAGQQAKEAPLGPGPGSRWSPGASWGGKPGPGERGCPVGADTARPEALRVVCTQARCRLHLPIPPSSSCSPSSPPDTHAHVPHTCTHSHTCTHTHSHTHMHMHEFTIQPL